jgi:hypothetical protein
MQLQIQALSERQRKFARDVGGVVLGVLIALGIGEVADAIRWDVRANKSQRAIWSELGRNAGVFEERQQVQVCLDRRLGELKAVVAEARRSRTLPSLGEIGRPPVRPVEEAAWNVTSGSETLLHLDTDIRTALSGIYSQLRGYSDQVLQEQEMWATLRLLENSPGPVSDDLLAEASGSLARLQFVAWHNSISAEQLARYIKALGIRPDYQIIFDRQGQRQELLALVRERSICKPLSRTIAS